MTMRTVQFIAYGFGPTPATLTATMNGVVIHDGPIPTQDLIYSLDLELSPEQQVGFTCEIPMEAATFPMSIVMTNGSAVFGPVTANYNTYTLPPGSTRTYDGFGDIYQTGPDCRSDVTIDGIPQATETIPDRGDFWFYVEEDQVFNFTLNANAGVLPPT